MALHVPAHHAGVSGDHLFRNFLAAVAIAIVAIVAVGVISTVRLPATPAAVDQAQSILQYRAAERADWAAGVPTEAGSLLEYRAGERVVGPGSDRIWTGQPGPR